MGALTLLGGDCRTGVVRVRSCFRSRPRVVSQATSLSVVIAHHVERIVKPDSAWGQASPS